MRLKQPVPAVMLLLWVAVANYAVAYEYNTGGDTWPGATATFQVDIPAPNDDPIWDDAFEAAAATWSVGTLFQYDIIRGSYADPCATPSGGNGVNGVEFNDKFCGTDFGSTTLAIASFWTSGNDIIQAGVVFNSKDRTWNVYDGDWQFGVADFRRVAVHELGHCLGLGHEDDVPAIMSTFAGDTEIPQQDDINGVNSLYGVPPPVNIDITPIIELLLN